jgi:hypothetical protein
VKRLVLPLIAVGMLAACGGAETDPASPAAAASPSDSSTPATQPAAAPSSTPARPGEPTSSVPANVPEALKFAAPLVGGGDIELTTLAGRPVLLWFWAPW